MVETLTLASAVLCVLMGGIFFAFSSFVIPALGRLAPHEAIRAMQRINVDVFHWTFMSAFFGTPAVCLLTVFVAQFEQTAGRSWVLAGAAIYWLGSLLVTGLGNVPLNNALARVEATAVEGERTWSRYLVRWVQWNHLRTAACLVAGCAFLLALD